jgi:hypothetical protein
MVFEIARIAVDPLAPGISKRPWRRLNHSFAPMRGAPDLLCNVWLKNPASITSSSAGLRSRRIMSVSGAATISPSGALAGPFFVEPPKVVHVETVIGEVGVKFDLPPGRTKPGGGFFLAKACGEEVGPISAAGFIIQTSRPTQNAELYAPTQTVKGARVQTSHPKLLIS